MFRHLNLNEQALTDCIFDYCGAEVLFQSFHKPVKRKRLNTQGRPLLFLKIVASKLNW